MGHIGAGAQQGVVLLDAPQRHPGAVQQLQPARTLERGGVAQAQLQYIQQFALCYREGAVHVEFAHGQFGIADEAQLRRAGLEANAQRRAAPVSDFEHWSRSALHLEVAIPDQGGQTQFQHARHGCSA